MATSGLTANEKLTIEALKQHDKVHPTFRAKKKIPSSKGRREGTAESGGLSKRLLRVSTSDGPPGGIPLGSPSAKSGTNFSVFQVVHATRTWKRFTQQRRRATASRQYNLENTFRMEPREDGKFLPVTVENMIKRQLQFRLTDVTYSENCKEIAKDLSGEIKDRIKSLNFPRFKLVCNVIIMENKGQGIHVTSRSIWNAETDNFACYTFKNPSLIATAYVHGVYFE